MPLLQEFQNPTLIWNIINYLTFMLEKNVSSSEGLVECFNSFSVKNLLDLGDELVDESVVDMLRHVFVTAPDSDVILKLICSVLEHKLQAKASSLFTGFWLFSSRVVSPSNPEKH